MQRFHVLDADGCWQTGAAGFIELWTHLPYYRMLAAEAAKHGEASGYSLWILVQLAPEASLYQRSMQQGFTMILFATISGDHVV